MNPPIEAGAYLAAGELSKELLWSYSSRPEEVIYDIELLADSLDNMGYSEPTTVLRELAKEIETAYKHDPDAFKEENLVGGPSERLPHTYLAELNKYMTEIRSHLFSEVAPKYVLVLDQTAVSESLRALSEKTKDEHQLVLIQETIRCLECGACRAAMVTGWNLAFDHLRQWIYASKRKRLKQLNAVLTARNRKPPEVVHYEDFFELRERDLLDDAYEAKLFKKGKHQYLCNALSHRNHFAHPSRMKASPVAATGYIDGLIGNIITDPHFAYRSRAGT